MKKATTDCLRLGYSCVCRSLYRTG